ncbi:DUF3106 domain-containing protein [Thermomonas flagellata]|uniref:DUF3106 domain-containing protein n=1 Tax=Thermomonas flagellata TaxID=2888524 RepID=UPI001F03E941|nr:DUF3106 domain-containing protein [Thermomonas flagellata]
MTAAPPSHAAAVAAFLRGQQRRAQVLAAVQAGTAEAAGASLEAVARVFAGEAAARPLADWPVLYWQLLLGLPAMRHSVPEPAASPLPALSALAPGVRAAVLLQLLGGLDEAGIGAVLGVPAPTWQDWIRNALPTAADGQPDVAVWRAWQAALRQAQEAAATPPAPPPSAPVPAAAPAHMRPAARAGARRGWRLAGAALLLAVAAAAAWWWLAAPRGGIARTPLPPAEAPKARYAADDPGSEPDRALLEVPSELALAERLPLLAWLEASEVPLPDVPAAAPPTAAGPAWQARVQAWRALPPLERARRRAAWAAWQALDADERMRLRALAVRFDALPPAQQQALRAGYERQPADARDGWWLGPRLGRAWPAIAPLFAYVDAGERAALRAALQQATTEELAVLARLAQSTAPEARAALRRGWLAQPPAQRAAWLQARLQG